MKRFSFLAVAATAIITLSACGTANNENAENNENTSETASVEANGEEEEEESEENKEQADEETASEADKEAESDASAEDSSSTEENATENEEESVDSSDTSSEEASSENASPEDNATEENASEDTANSEEVTEESAEDSEDANAEAKSASSSEEEEAVTEEVTVYYLDGDLMETISETRSLEAASENDLPFEAVQAWLDGPETEDATGPLPVETEVQFVEFKDNTAYVSFEPSVLDATTVGSTLELAFVEQLAVLMDQFGYGQTQILIDGEVVTDFYGHREINQPIEATDPSELYGSN
ncbi:GerMN domain-containing protein [Marinococcus halotolerans]|uniref:GerMN domain-containing protein n=1 Tax=Marinococcus halotolerans TaxID=301092 RepID=UPI0003B72CFC|nr:GerMN domain-containing protein [Marinococcus halotolerans]